MTITDIYSRMYMVMNTQKVSGHTIIKTLERWINIYKKPEVIILDNDRQYTSTVFKE